MKAMILAAGKGERLRPFTLTMPKPLVPVNGKPLIIWHIERLARAGIKDIVINHAWQGHQLEDTLKNGLAWGVNIAYSPEAHPLGTGGGIKQALPLLGHAPFIVISGDIATDYPFSRLIKKQISANSSGHLVMVSNPDHHPEGDYYLEKTLIKTKNDHTKTPDSKCLTFGSIALLRPGLFQSQPACSFSIATPFEQAIQQGHLTGEHFTGYHCNVDTPERLERVESSRRAGKIKDSEI